MNIDDTKRCICNPPLSAKKKKCPRCNPKRKVVTFARTSRDIKPAQTKKHNGIKTGLLPWLHPAPEPATSTSTEADPYENLIDNYGEPNV